MFVLIIASGYPTPKYGGNGIFEFDQAKALTQAAGKVVYAAVDLRSLRRWRKWGCEHFYKDGVEVYAINIPLGRAPHSVLKRAGQMGLKYLYRRIMEDHGEPDVVHSHFFEMAEIALVLKLLATNAKFIMTEHSSLIAVSYELYPEWLKKCAKKVYEAYDDVICVSSSLAETLKTRFNINANVIFNMIDPVFLTAISGSTSSVHANTFRFVFVGNLIDGKRPKHCIQSFYDAFYLQHFLTADGKNIVLELIGQGPLFSECERLIAGLGIGKNVTLHGFQTREKIAEIFHQSDCFVLPSKLETFGVVYIEAMACGLPVIATKCGGPESFIDDTKGLLIPVDDETVLVGALRYMVCNVRKYNHKYISNDARARFSPQAIAKELVAIYESL